MTYGSMRSASPSVSLVRFAGALLGQCPQAGQPITTGDTGDHGGSERFQVFPCGPLCPPWRKISLARIVVLTMPDDPTTQEPNRQQAEDHYYAALDLVAAGHDDQAVLEYRKSLADDPTFTDALHGLSRALQNLNRLDEAIEVAQRISEIDPDDVLAHTSLSILYQKKGMVPEAEAEGNKARVLGWKQQLKKGSP